MKEIQLNQGLVALVDDEDFAWAKEHHWRVEGSKKRKAKYAIRNEFIRDETKKCKYRRKWFRLSREIFARAGIFLTR